MIQFTWKVLLLAVAYYGAGWLGVMLAVPRGYTTGIWPPAGVAVAAMLIFGWRFWPGVFLGACLTSTHLAMRGGELHVQEVAMLAIWHGAIATLQAGIGAKLVRRYVGFPNPLTQQDDIIRFLLLAGPVGCLVGATLGVTSLHLFELVDRREWILEWCTWYLGDALGVLIVAPLMLIVAGHPRPLWRGRWLSVGVPIVIGFIVALAAYSFARQYEQQHVYDQFSGRASMLAHRIEETVNRHIEVVHSTKSLYASSREVTRDEFHQFTSPLLARHEGIRALEWIPRVQADRRETMEAMAREQGWPNYRITERAADGRLAPAGERDAYFPVYFLEPSNTNEAALGFDLASDPLRRRALEQACDTATTVLTPPLQLVQDTDELPGVLVFEPFWGQGKQLQTVAERRDQLLGYVLGVLRVDTIVETALASRRWDEIEIQVTDVTQPRNPFPMYLGQGGKVKHERSFIAAGAQANRWYPLWTDTVQVMDRTWRFDVMPSPAYLIAARSLQPLVVLAGGMLFTGLLGAFLLIGSGRAAEIEALVVERTEQLTQANRELENEVLERKRADEALLQAHQELEKRVEQRTYELRQSQHRYQDLYDNAPDMFATIDVTTERIVECNATFLASTGFDREEIFGRSVFDLFHPDCLEDARQAFDLLLTRGELRDAEFSLLRKDQERLDVSLNVSAVRDEQGKVVHLRSVWLDITDRKQAEEKIRQQQAELAHVARFSTMGEMAAGLAHEINQPLAAIAAFAEGAAMRIRNGTADLNSLGGVVTRISDDVHRAGEIIRRLRRFIRKREPQRTRIDVNHLVRDVIQFVASDAAHQEVAIELQLTPGLPLAKGDAIEVQQVLLNLIRNGMDAMMEVPVDQRRLSVATVPWEPDMVEVVVRDQGHGIAEGEEDQVFEAFFSSKSEGLGMGLAISRSLVESNGGKIWVTPGKGSGAAFHFTLPLEQS